MEYKYFRFSMNDGSEGKRWGYSMGNGEYVISDESISFDAIDEIPYDEATGVLRSWLKKRGVVTNTIEIDTVVANAYSKGSASARFMYEDGGSCKITVETTSNPTVEWEDVSLNKDTFDFSDITSSRRIKSGFKVQFYDDRNPSKIIREIKDLPNWRTAFDEAERLCDTTYAGWRYVDYDIIPDNNETSNLGNYMNNSRNTEYALNKIFSNIK